MSLPIAPEMTPMSKMNESIMAWDKINSQGLWPIDKLRSARLLTGHARKVSSAAWHPDSRTLVAADQAGNVILWDAMSKSKLQYTNKPFVTAVAMSPDRTKHIVALGGLDNMITICDMSVTEDGSGPGTPKEVPATGDGHDGSITNLHFSAADTIISTAGDGDVRVWDIHSSKCSQKMSGHTRDATSLSFAQDATGGPLFATSSLDGTVRLWDLRTGKTTAAFKASDEVCTSNA